MGHSALYWEITERVLADHDALGHAGNLVVAALEGPAALATALEAPGEAPSTAPEAPRPRPAEVWLRSVTLAGFRGIGPPVQLDLDPGPGLVLLVGPNGSGKTSLAEGLEVLVTGDARRLHGLSKEWREGWRNLHTTTGPRVEAQFAVAGRGPATLRRVWPGDGPLSDSALSTTPADLDWSEALETFRPFLGTGELARSLDKGPSVVYDALQSILGLNELTEATQLLATARKEAKAHLDAVKAQAAALLAALEDLDDPRATSARAALRGKGWDLDALERLAFDEADAHDDGLAPLRALAELVAPAGGSVDGLRAAAAAQAATAGTLAEQEHRAADVLRAALSWHEAAGDGPCPVCRETPLDAGWRAHASAWRATHAAAALASTEATRALRDREAEVRSTLRPPPDGLAPTDTLDTRPVTEAWAALLAGRHLGGVALADHVEATLPPLAEAVRDLRERARAELHARQDRWRPVALQLGAWVTAARAAAAAPARVQRLTAAEKWLKATEATLRDQRFEPLSQEACLIWSLLRQGSHVDLAKVSLAGSGTRRRVELNVTVDGADTVALGVMSQGEVNALALSLFLPRMTLADSPFRFLVVDDPVQAMDPHKVDGLARVLAGVASTRQVLVLTHDPRLREALRRLQLPATVYEVQRRGDSVVELRQAMDPVRQHLSDARAVALHADQLGAVPSRVVPGLCRTALEAALTGVVRRRRLARGEAFADVAELLAAHHATTSLAALALFDEAHRGADVLPRLSRHDRRAADVFQIVKKGAHQGFRGDLEALVQDTEALVRFVERLP